MNVLSIERRVWNTKIVRENIPAYFIRNLDPSILKIRTEWLHFLDPSLKPWWLPSRDMGQGWPKYPFFKIPIKLDLRAKQKNLMSDLWDFFFRILLIWSFPINGDMYPNHCYFVKSYGFTSNRIGWNSPVATNQPQRARDRGVGLPSAFTARCGCEILCGDPWVPPQNNGEEKVGSKFRAPSLKLTANTSGKNHPFLGENSRR